ncbi:sugar dehydrogenase complex small subunit [Klebsiella sp. 2680]|uniref:sugar dehydrogenase complex small subunit n=1 Tax=Klebsiella sp. 2680 TaxID=2018037 RepID=UPI00163D22B4|nr:sugar dehydrogenase complex small subunit [Klebsiella sp. 2680]
MKNNRKKHESLPDFSQKGFSRRDFLFASAAVLGSFSVLSTPGLAWAKTGEATGGSDIHHIAQLVTGKTIAPSLAQRVAEALTTIDADFPQKLARLSAFIANKQVTDIETLKVTAGFEGELKATAQAIISGLYLGYVGEPVMLSSEDNVQFVTYTGALTYQLTTGYTPVPSYSRWGSGYWQYLPEKAVTHA